MFKTQNLTLRAWRDIDIKSFRNMMQDLEVMEFIPQEYMICGDAASNIKLFNEHLNQFGYTIFACELKESGEFVGCAGALQRSVDEQNTIKETIISFYISRAYWGLGLAIEAIQKCFEIIFQDSCIDSVVGYTSTLNLRSQKVMQKLGMKKVQNITLLHPKLPPDHRLAPHVKYCISRGEYGINLLELHQPL